MCERAIEIKTELNLHCLQCGSEKVINTHKYENVKGELGFNIVQPVYKCEECGEEFFVCPECNGTGYITSYDDIHDCDICHGMGVVKKE